MDKVRVPFNHPNSLGHCNYDMYVVRLTNGETKLVKPEDLLEITSMRFN